MEQQNYMPTSWQQRDEIIENYFHLGFKQKEIIEFLDVQHEIQLGIRQLQRILHYLGLRRRGAYDINAVIDAVQSNLLNNRKEIGYRTMHDRITKLNNLKVDKNTVRLILRYLDPQGVLHRQKHSLHRREYLSQGPNYVWHVDGWDKLKQFGLCIHGCIDGYSRRLMWLRVASTNHDPFVIGRYFMDCITQINGVPTKIRSDRGTENVNIEAIQQILRSRHGDLTARTGTSFMYGKSTHNQRIENWWSKFKQLGMNIWIDHFKMMVDAGIIDSSCELNIQCVRYCYMHILQIELDTILKLWNTHYIRKNRNLTSPSGRPDVMYHLPHLYGSVNHLKPIDSDDVNHLQRAFTDRVPVCISIYKELFDLYCRENNKTTPGNLREADDLFVFLLDAITDDHF